MKYIPLLIILAFGCKKKKVEPIPMPLTIYVDTVNRVEHTLKLKYTVFKPGKESIISITESDDKEMNKRKTYTYFVGGDSVFTFKTQLLYVRFYFHGYYKTESGTNYLANMNVDSYINGDYYRSDTGSFTGVSPSIYLY